MSLWSRNECRIVLQPHQLVLAHLRRGLNSRVLAKRFIPCPAPGDGQPPWSGALKALEAVMPEIAEHRAHATVILSNHFMRYAMVPWSDALNDEAEEISYARHTFGEMYGREVGDWELRISPGRAGDAQLASAVDARLLGALRDLFGRHRVGLGSIRPHLMHACNVCRAALQRRSGWLVLVERGNLCLALLQNGRLAWVRSMRTGSHWHMELPFLLNREELVANIEVPSSEVLLWMPEQQRAPAVAGGRWKLRTLQPPRMPSMAPKLDNRFAMYMSD